MNLNRSDFVFSILEEPLSEDFNKISITQHQTQMSTWFKEWFEAWGDQNNRIIFNTAPQGIGKTYASLMYSRLVDSALLMSSNHRRLVDIIETPEGNHFSHRKNVLFSCKDDDAIPLMKSAFKLGISQKMAHDALCRFSFAQTGILDCPYDLMLYDFKNNEHKFVATSLDMALALRLIEDFQLFIIDEPGEDFFENTNHKMPTEIFDSLHCIRMEEEVVIDENSDPILLPYWLVEQDRAAIRDLEKTMKDLWESYQANPDDEEIKARLTSVSSTLKLHKYEILFDVRRYEDAVYFKVPSKAFRLLLSVSRLDTNPQIIINAAIWQHKVAWVEREYRKIQAIVSRLPNTHSLPRLSFSSLEITPNPTPVFCVDVEKSVSQSKIRDIARNLNIDALTKDVSVFVKLASHYTTRKSLKPLVICHKDLATMLNTQRHNGDPVLNQFPWKDAEIRHFGKEIKGLDLKDINCVILFGDWIDDGIYDKLYEKYRDDLSRAPMDWRGWIKIDPPQAYTEFMREEAIEYKDFIERGRGEVVCFVVGTFFRRLEKEPEVWREIFPKHKFRSLPSRVIKILSAFDLRDGKFTATAKEIIEKTGLPLTSIRRELNTLIARNILVASTEAKYIVYTIRTPF